MAKMSLFPYQIKTVQKSLSEVPYGIEQIKAPELWNNNETGEGVVVAVLDTGIDTSHPDLISRVVDGRNFTKEGTANNITDGNGHGTHVAGTVAATLNGFGVVGVAPDVKLLICKVLDSQGVGDYNAITKAIRYATRWTGENGERVRVINMSLGGSIPDREQYRAILDACAKGIAVVVASGNEGDANEETLEYGYPALYPECITVAACDRDEKLAPFSNNSKQVDVIAAGVDVASTYPIGQYAVLSGTSMATPHISGALAIIISHGEKYFERTLSESEIYAMLIRCTRSLGYKPTSEGHGLLDLSVLNKKYPLTR